MVAVVIVVDVNVVVIVGATSGDWGFVRTMW